MQRKVKLWTLAKLFFFVGTISFGGGIFAYLYEYIVRDRKWLTEKEYFDVLEISQILPGPNAVNISIIIGDKLQGALGALIAVICLMLPGAIIILLFGIFYLHHPHNSRLVAFLTGVAAAAVGFILFVTFRISKHLLFKLRDLLLIIMTFIAVGILHISLIIVLLTLVPLAILFHRPKSQNKSGQSS